MNEGRVNPGLAIVTAARVRFPASIAHRSGILTRPAGGGRVRERRCHRSLPSEPDVRLSPHPAQAATKPRVSGAGFHDGLIPASWRWMPNFLKNARSLKYDFHCGSNGLASFRIFMWRRILVSPAYTRRDHIGLPSEVR